MRIMRRSAVWEAGGWEKWVRQSRNHEEKTICGRLNEKGYKTAYTQMRAFHLFGDDEHDPWGYPKDMKPEDHGHHEVWPPVNVYGRKGDYDPATWLPK